MHPIGKIFLRGLAAVVPIALTLYLLWWLGSSAENLLGPLIRRVIPGDFYVPGLGVVLGLVSVLGVGALLGNWMVSTIWSTAEGLVGRIPLVKTVYGSVKDLMGFFARSDEQKRLNKVVMVRMSDPPMQLLGLVTSDDASVLTRREQDSDQVAVYLPMSYQIGGFMVLVPRTAIEPVDMTVEEALRLIVTAGLSNDAAKGEVASGRAPR